MRLAALFLFFSNSVIGENAVFPLSSYVRRTQDLPLLRRAEKSCLILMSEKDYEDGHEEDQPLECELQDVDMNGTGYKKVRLSGLTTSWAQENQVISGFSTFFSKNAQIDDSAGELIIPTGASIEIGNATDATTGFSPGIVPRGIDPNDIILNRRLRTGTKRVLVLRAVAFDSSTTASEAQLSDDIFGTSGDAINLKNQYRACSDGQLIFEPLTTNSLVGTDGVYTVNIPSTVIADADDEDIATEMIDKATADLGSLASLADHVMVCVPPGTSGSWIAYAYVNYWLSVYNDVWCQYASGPMHEIGHNLNLAHSGEGSEEYGDRSGIMGIGYRIDEGPIMCFNGAKTWQLGWYSPFHVDLPIGTSYAWNGNLIGFSQKPFASATDKMIVRIKSSKVHVYVHYNAMIGFNNGTREGRNQVLVATRRPGTGYSESNLEAKLNATNVFVIPNFAGTTNALTIKAVSIVTATIPARAVVHISLGPLLPTSAPIPTPSPTRLPTSGRPTQFPTSKPTLSPTRVPTARPTPFPTTKKPTPFPTGMPITSKPSPLPTTIRPTSLPTTIKPTSLPTTRKPTLFPTTLKPTRLPTARPTSSPTTKKPTPFPSGMPTTKKPTRFPTASSTTLMPTLDPVTSSPIDAPSLWTPV